MTTRPLSPTQAQILTTAAQHPARLAEAPANLPAAARSAVFQSMLRARLLEEMSGAEGTVLRITELGVLALGTRGVSEADREAVVGRPEGMGGQQASTAAPPGQEVPVEPPAASQPLTSLREAATALLMAWDAGLERPALPASMEALRAALDRRRGPTRPARGLTAPRPPREGTKQQRVLTLLRRPEGVTIAQVIEATGWAQHTVRGFLAGLKRKGHTVEVLERVRQVGPGSQGAKGSYSIYRIATAAEVQG